MENRKDAYQRMEVVNLFGFVFDDIDHELELSPPSFSMVALVSIFIKMISHFRSNTSLKLVSKL